MLSGFRAPALILLSFAVALSACSKKPVFEEPEVVYQSPKQVASEAAKASKGNVKSSSAATILKSSLLIEVPFAPQAPFANWDALHEEACEEMALIMVERFLAGKSLSLQDAEAEVQKLIAWETDHGYGYDVTVKELGTIAEEFYGRRARVLENVTAEMIRKELAAGHPVIVPAAGRDLGNPFFSGAGPWYHMLVITGYTKDGFITNDPGTKRGEKYWYPTERFMNAIHDWTGVKEEIRKGERRALVVE